LAHEIHYHKRKIYKPLKGMLLWSASIWSNLITEAGWNKAVQHLREQNLIVDEPKDIGGIIKEVIKDIEEEEKEYIKEELYTAYIKSIKSGVTVGIPEWYKRKLLNNLKEDSDNG